MGVNGKQKGASGELELVNFFKSFGVRAHRSQQFSGKGESAADIILDDFKNVHIECKRTEQFKLYTAVEQAREDSKGNFPVVAYRKNNKPWIFLVEAELLIQFLLTHGFIGSHDDCKR